jgi:hypothetical protein
MTGSAFRKMALSMTGASEQPHFERSSFRVGTKIFATMTKDGDEAMVRVVPKLRCKDLIKEHPEVFFSHGYWTQKMGAIGIHLAKADAKLMRELMTDAWQAVAPKRR